MNRKMSGGFVLMSLLLFANFRVAAQETVAAASGQQAGVESAGQQAPAPSAKTTQAEAMLMVDYQIVPVRGNKSLDLIGFHVLNKFNDWLYLGIGGHAPLFKGEYGGFMVFDATAHVQRKISGNLFVDGGLSLGGGGGGKSVVQSRIISGSGGFIKAYAGLGYDFGDFSVGANVSRVKFTDSSISHSQLNLYVQAPFSYAIGSYASSGERASASSVNAGAADSENMLSLGLDNLDQIDPQGSNKRTINMVDMQFSHFMTKNSYWFFNAAAGYRGRPLYNQVFGGAGYRFPVSPQVAIYGQLGIGSGGYAPEIIDTGPGLLIYPKLSAEYMISKNLGIALSAGYMFAPKATSKNYTFGAALNYHIHAGDGSPGENGVYSGYRFNLFQQTQYNVKFRGDDQIRLNMLSIQMDKLVSDHVYIPIQVSGAYTSYLGYPGYGELVAGLGLQTRFEKADRFQFFGQLLIGANPNGPILKAGLGLNYSLSDRLAIYATAGQTLARLGAVKEKFRADYVGIGVTYRFSVPSW